MIEDIVGWFTDKNFALPLTFMILPYKEKGFDWIPFASAALGGMLSLSASLLAFYLSNKAEKSRRIEQEQKTEAMHAMTGYFKLLNSVNLLANIKKHIDKSFAAAHEEGISTSDPYHCVGPSAGKFLEPERLKTEEYIFLLRLGDVDTINKVLLIEHRAVNTQELLDKYSEQRVELENWIESLPAISRTIDGLKRVDDIPVEYGVTYETKGAKLNQLLYGVIEHLESDITEGQEILDIFVKSARSLYAPHFPVITNGVDYNR